MSDSISRRDFLKKGAVLGAGALLFPRKASGKGNQDFTYKARKISELHAGEMTTEHLESISGTEGTESISWNPTDGRLYFSRSGGYELEMSAIDTTKDNSIENIHRGKMNIYRNGAATRLEIENITDFSISPDGKRFITKKGKGFAEIDMEGGKPLSVKEDARGKVSYWNGRIIFHPPKAVYSDPVYLNEKIALVSRADRGETPETREMKHMLPESYICAVELDGSKSSYHANKASHPILPMGTGDLGEHHYIEQIREYGESIGASNPDIIPLDGGEYGIIFGKKAPEIGKTGSSKYYMALLKDIEDGEGIWKAGSVKRIIYGNPDFNRGDSYIDLNDPSSFRITDGIRKAACMCTIAKGKKGERRVIIFDVEPNGDGIILPEDFKKSKKYMDVGTGTSNTYFKSIKISPDGKSFGGIYHDTEKNTDRVYVGKLGTRRRLF